MADTKLTAMTENTTPIATDILYMIDDPGGAPADRKAQLLNVVAGSLLASQLVNEIKGWPPIINTGDLDALNLWWDKVGTPSTAPSVVAGNDGGITFNYNRVLKVVADGANEGLSQIWTYADEPRVKSGRKLSTLWAIWCVGGVGVTASLINSDASNTAAAKVTAAAWTIVEIPNHTLAGTTCTVQLITDGAGTFYAVPLGANIGPRGFALPPRPSRYTNFDAGAAVVSGADPGGTAWTDADCTALTSPLAWMVALATYYFNGTTAGKNLSIRRNGSAGGGGACLRSSTISAPYRGTAIVDLDDGQIFEWGTSAAAADVEEVYFTIVGWWEWA